MIGNSQRVAVVTIVEQELALELLLFIPPT
jgi:hypothetical protein